METLASADVSAEGAGFVRWEPEYSAFSIELSRALVPQILEAVAESRRQGIETGGLLIGCFPKASVPTIRITRFLPIERRTEDGIPFVLTPAQRMRFAEAVGEANTRETSAVGFFRTSLGTDRTLTSEDLKLSSDQFNRAIHVGLLVASEFPQKSALFLSISGKMAHEPIVQPFTFEPAELNRLVRNESTYATAPVESGKREAPFLAPPEPLVKEQPAAGRWWVNAILLFAILAALMAGIALGPLIPGSRMENWMPKSKNGLGLRVQPTHQLLRVSWNHQSPEIYKAKTAMLVIMDAGRQRQLKLEPGDLERGTLTYENAGPHVLLTMVLSMPQSVTLSQSVAWEQP